MKFARAIFGMALLSALLCALAQAQAPRRFGQRLDGYWNFELDPNDAGLRQEWFKREFRGRIKLPGILQSQEYGLPISTNTPWVLTLYDRFWYLREDYKAYTEPGKVKVPFLSQPPRHYLGAAWYQRDLRITPNMVGRRLVLTLERPHWGTTVWIDDRILGSQLSLVAPHVYDLGPVPPGNHRLTIRIDNRMLMAYRPDAHSVSDSLGASWNGIAGAIELTDTGRVWIDDAQVFPNLAQHTMLIKVRIGNTTGRSGSATLTAIWPDMGVVPVNWDENGGTAEIQVPIRLDAETWDEFHPKRSPLRLWLKGSDVDESKDLLVGLRDFHAEGNQFILNGRPIIFRGTHHGGDFPLTGYPPTDLKYWLDLFKTCKKWGLNHMRFHSWCPPEAAFEAADQVGFYLQPEPGMWNEISPGTPMERMLYEETDRMIRAYGNHPSFMLLSASNEPKGKWQDALSKWVGYYHALDPRRLYASGTGHTERELEHITEGTDYLAMQRINQMMLRRESGWFGGDFRESLTDINIPVISHEVGQWVAYPDYEIIKKFKSAYLQPRNYEIFRDSMEAHGLLKFDQQFARASGRFQLECYKEEIEANLRTPGLGGFQLLDLHDYLGQGTALVGLLDAFWESKGYVSAEDFTEFCNATVPLARLPRRAYTKADTFTADVELAHFGAEPMKDGKAVWLVSDPAHPVTGEWPTQEFPIGKNQVLGKISVPLFPLASGEHTLTVTVAPAKLFDPNSNTILPGEKRGVTYFQNEWKFWVYPPEVPDRPQGNGLCPLAQATDILVTSSWDEAEKRLAAGGKVLFSPRNVDLDWRNPPLDTVPIFWNRQMGPAWSRMLGIFVDIRLDEAKSHALDAFPTSNHFDWQWASLMNNVRAINLDELPRELEPVVWAIDDWNRNYRLGVIFECTIGDGKLLVSAIDVTKPNSSNPVARQFRYSLINYMASDCFLPRIPVMASQMRSLFFDNRIMKKLGAKAQIGGESAGQIIDGDPNTFIVAGDKNATIREPVEMFVTFPAPVTMSGLVLMPRQNHREHEGDIREYSVQVSENGDDWREVNRGELGSTFAPQTITFARTVTTRYLKLVSLSGFGTDKLTALADVAVMYVGPKLDDQGNPSMEYQRNRTATPEIDEGVDKRAKPTPTPGRP
jgi:hypothetical protein